MAARKKKAMKKSAKQVWGTWPNSVRGTKVASLELILVDFTNAIVNEYTCDPSKPSVLVSLLSDGQFYASVLRYKERFGEGKVVVCNARHASLHECVRLLAENWLTKRSAKEKLAQDIKCDARFGDVDDIETFQR